MWIIVLAVVGSLVAVTFVVAMIAQWCSPEAQNARGARWKQRSLTLLQKGDVAGAIRADLAALRIFQKTGYDRARVATHIALARTYRAAGNKQEARNHLEVAYRDSHKRDYEQFLIESADLLGEYFMGTREPREALRYLKEAAALEEQETGCAKAISVKAPMPGGRFAIVARHPVEVVFRRVHAILRRARVAQACLAAGDPSEAACILASLKLDLEALQDPRDPRAGEAMNTAFYYAAMDQTGGTLHAFRACMTDVLRAVCAASPGIVPGSGQPGLSPDVLGRTCEELLSFCPQLEQELRKIKFSRGYG
jgi:tetratricopeptide (TPR) repeat protein